MTAEQFAYWLNGFVELNGQGPNPDQWESIKEHLSTVFMKITPKMPPVYAPGPVAPLAEPIYYPPIDPSFWQPNPSPYKRGDVIC